MKVARSCSDRLTTSTYALYAGIFGKDGLGQSSAALSGIASNVDKICWKTIVVNVCNHLLQAQGLYIYIHISRS